MLTCSSAPGEGELSKSVSRTTTACSRRALPGRLDELVIRARYASGYAGTTEGSSFFSSRSAIEMIVGSAQPAGVGGEGDRRQASGAGRVTPLDVEHDALEPVRIRLHLLDDRVSDRLILVSTEARRYQDDARVLGVRRDGFTGESEEIDDVPRDNGPAFAGGVLQLRAVLLLAAADLVGARGVWATSPKEEGNGRRQVLIEVELHRVKRTSPGYCFSIASGVSAAFASI